MAYLIIVWLALQVVAVVSQLLVLPPSVGNIAAISLIAATPVVCYLAWFYQYHSGRLQLIAATDGKPPAMFGSSQFMAILLIVIVSTLLAYQYYLLSRPAAKPESANMLAANSIAVLPFSQLLQESDTTGLANSPELTLLTNSLAEEISSQLGRTPGLTVASASSGQILSRQQLSLLDIASRLQVASLLTGTISLQGQQLQIRVQLLDGSNSQTLWTNQLQRQLTDVFALESEIARSVVNALQASLPEGSSLLDLSANASTQSADAYISYLKAREQYRLQTSEAMQQARKLFEQAIAQDPEYALAYVGLADTLLLLSDGSKEFGIIDVDIATVLAKEYLEKALIRAPQLAEAYAIKGKMLELQQQFEPALAAYQQAIALNPNLAVTHMWQYLLLKQHGQYKESLQALERAYQLDPVSVAILYNRGYEQAIRGQFVKASASFTQLLQDFPESPLGHAGLAINAFHQGELADSIYHWQQAHHISPENTDYHRNYLGLVLSLGLTIQHPELADIPRFRNSYLLRSGNFSTLFEEMAFKIAAQPDDRWLKFEMAWYQMLAGETLGTVKLLIESYRTFTAEDLYAMPMCSPAIEIAWALMQEHKEAEAGILLARCQQQLNDAMQGELRDSYLNHLAARLAALEGNNEQAVQQLRQALAYGWREWWTFYDPILHSIPTKQLAPLRQQLEKALSEQRQLVLTRAKQPAPAD